MNDKRLDAWIIFAMLLVFLVILSTLNPDNKFGGPMVTEPNPMFTPGEVRNMTVEEICDTTWSKIPRKIYTSDKKYVAKQYNIPWELRAEYEFDHLIPRCLGGADSRKNLFPQYRKGNEGALIKDKTERRACVMVCKGQLDLKETQLAFANDWVSLYKEIYSPLRRMLIYLEN